MPHTVNDLRKVPLDDLPQEGGPPSSMKYYSVEFEFQRRQTKAQIEAAESAKRSVRWMFWSVFVLALFSFLSFVLDLLTFLQ